MSFDLRKSALWYHNKPSPGKISISATKSTETQDDLALCYTPGVAEPVKEIAADPSNAYRYTSKGNLVGIITNGTAVLGLGHVGALASKPVMEGKAVLFKRFADIDAFDIEINCDDPHDFIETVKRIAPTFGAINLEDIKAPECFIIEKTLSEQLDIPVLHDDQHGTAIVIAAGLLNGLELQNKNLSDVTIVCAGAGSAGIAAMRLLKKLGADSNRILMIDRAGVIHADRKDLNEYKKEFAVQTSKRTLEEAVAAADIFIGVSGPGILTPDMLASMNAKPIVFALSNPTPEIMPDVARKVRTDLILATGRSDYPNQVNNALCFPYLFRGALDVHATCINQAMQLAAVYAIKNLAHEPLTKQVMQAYGLTQKLQFGPDYILPMMLDARLKETVSDAVKAAAIESGVARQFNVEIPGEN